MDKGKVIGFVVLALGILLIAAIIVILVVYMVKGRSRPVATEGFYQTPADAESPTREDISSQIHIRFHLNEDKPTLYLNLITSSLDPKPSVAEYNDTTSNGLYNIANNKDDFDSLNVPTIYFRLQPVTAVTEDAKKYYKYEFSTGFKLVDGSTENDDSEITVFSLKRQDGTERHLNIHNVTLADFKNIASNRDKFYNTSITATAPVPNWFTVLLLPKSSTTNIESNKGISYDNTDSKLVIVNNPSAELMTDADKYSKFSPLPRVRDLSGKVLLDKSGYIQGTIIQKDTSYPNTHYNLINIEDGKALTYGVGNQGGKLEFMEKDAGNKAQVFGIAQSINLNSNIENPGLLLIVPLIESSKLRLDQLPGTGKLDIVTVGAGGFGIVNVDIADLENDSGYLTENSIRVRIMYEYAMSTVIASNSTTYYIQDPIAIGNKSQISIGSYSAAADKIPSISMVSAGKDGEVYFYSQGFLLRVRVSKDATGIYSIEWANNLTEASPLAITPVTNTNSTNSNNYTLTDVASGAKMLLSFGSIPALMFIDADTEAPPAKFSLAESSNPTVRLTIHPDISTAQEYLTIVEAPPAKEETTTTTAAAGSTTTTTQPATGTTTTTTQPAAAGPPASASNLSDADLAKMDEMEKSTALLNERIAELKKDKQVLQTQLARLEGEGLQISDSDYNSKASNSKLRRVVGGQVDKVADMLEKLKALSATSAAASAAAHGATDYTQRGGTVKKTDTGISVSDYEGVLNIFYPQFV